MLPVKTIRIVKCAGHDREGLLAARIQELEAAGFNVLYRDLRPDPAWPYASATVDDRYQELALAMIEPESDAVLWARGGYGTSELLERLPWSAIKAGKKKIVVGFSDVCAMQSALYVMTGWPSIHGPMPASSLWNKNGSSDTDALIRLLKGESNAGMLKVKTLKSSEERRKIEGILFGGCLSVLTSLIGTPYLPRSFERHILVIEDISENPGRIIRMLNQWKQSGLFAGVSAIVFGQMTELGQNLPDNSEVLLNEIARRFDLPLFWTSEFGHVSPNLPFVVGSYGSIRDGNLNWKFDVSTLG
jgi:muramoyltetrapeptide carboxypeptidase